MCGRQPQTKTPSDGQRGVWTSSPQSRGSTPSCSWTPESSSPSPPSYCPTRSESGACERQHSNVNPTTTQPDAGRSDRQASAHMHIRTNRRINDVCISIGNRHPGHSLLRSCYDILVRWHNNDTMIGQLAFGRLIATMRESGDLDRISSPRDAYDPWDRPRIPTGRAGVSDDKGRVNPLWPSSINHGGHKPRRPAGRARAKPSSQGCRGRVASGTGGPERKAKGKEAR